MRGFLFDEMFLADFFYNMIFSFSFSCLKYECK